MPRSTPSTYNNVSYVLLLLVVLGRQHTLPAPNVVGDATSRDYLSWPGHNTEERITQQVSSPYYCSFTTPATAAATAPEAPKMKDRPPEPNLFTLLRNRRRCLLN